MWQPHPLFRRSKCVNPNPNDDVCEKYTSVFLTTGVPLLISLCLFIILAIVLFIIVRRKRRQRHAQEAEKNREIDDDNGDVELVVNTYPRDQAYKHFEAQETAGDEGQRTDHHQFERDLERQQGHHLQSRDVSPVGR
ncbi:uncharacterized protein Z520_02105 [Fonsecaea multimorphosa CBS 102226]|uniref:Uncharacterized protein n=1 Tax=Fonsecaea multimorphosa CBS 102226 TaxID=1442371 RepID=A0A0D2IY63_9EURO|nr:uncharacterized protein Z520_02105 [Fonsecaea multimorphosa CBS 102226]KIY01967.1 hypothetical protein Z520_02105 [Fonsecaea multimorphosa CBS 102226]OAL29648.1 hypothetical protein AYO22_02062 [Fonsecaea multimorphosa]